MLLIEKGSKIEELILQHCSAKSRTLLGDINDALFLKILLPSWNMGNTSLLPLLSGTESEFFRAKGFRQ